MQLKQFTKCFRLLPSNLVYLKKEYVPFTGGIILGKSNRLDRFCAKHPKIGVEGLMKYIVILNLIVYVLDMFSNGMLSYMLAFSPTLILQGEIWRLVTFIMVPEGNQSIFILITLYFYWFIGTTLEREWGSVKFTVYYGLGVIFTIIAGFILHFWRLGSFTNMYFVNMSLFLAFASLYPNMQVRLFFVIPIKVKWMAWFDLALFAYYCFQYISYGLWMLCLLPIAALINYLIFFWHDIGNIFGLVRHRTSRQTINFKQATKQAQVQKGYIHKCAVCGKTDATHPDMEFRYCSKCNGYYCYCTEHLASHTHIE